MFSKDFVKWLFIQGLYDNALQGAMRMGQMFSRADFLDRAILVQLGPESVADLMLAGTKVGFPQLQMPATPKPPRGGVVDFMRHGLGRAR